MTLFRPDPAIDQEIHDAAAANLKADAWVQIPVAFDLSGLRRRDHLTEAARAYGLTSAEIRRLREDYNPDEPRDDHGRWGDGGGDSHAVVTSSGTELGRLTDNQLLSESQHGDVQRAMDDALARSPELATGPHALVSATYLSDGRPDGMNYGQWMEAKDNMEGSQALTFPADMLHPENGERVIFNDTVKFDPSKEGAASTQTAYGVMEHEMGHVYFMAHGLDGYNQVARALIGQGLTPDVLARVSNYAASDPHEALGELYSMSHTPGYSLPSDIASMYAPIEAGAGAGTQPGTHVLLANTPENNRQIREAAAANIRAKAWVMRVPALERLRPTKESTARLREDYNPDEPRDEHGRWGDAGGGAIATEPKTVGGKNQAGLDEKEVQGRLLAIDKRNAQAATDRQWYQSAHDQINARAAAVGVDPQRFAGMVAATSPRTGWDTVNGKTPNLDKATKAALIAQDHPDALGDPRALADSLEHPGMFKDQLTSALRLFNGESPGKVLVAPKTASFYNNLMFPGKTDSVTVDEWMARAIAGVTDTSHYQDNPDTAKVLAGSGKNSGYSWAADQIRAAAATAGMSPDALQASVWSEYRREVGG